MFDPNSVVYIPQEGGNACTARNASTACATKVCQIAEGQIAGTCARNIRVFEAFYCIRNDWTRISMPDARFWTSTRDVRVQGGGTARVGINYTMAWGQGSRGRSPAWSFNIGNEEEAATRYAPLGRVNAPGRGCVYSRVPLIIRADRVRRVVQPTGSAASDGYDTGTESGNNTMSGMNDNDNARVCENGDTKCTDTARNALTTSGDFARTYFAIDSKTQRDMSTNKAMASGSAEMLGFKVIDPNDPEESEKDTPMPSTVSKSTPAVTLTLAPPWDQIYSALHNAARGSPIKWERGSYAGQMGLGVGWGFKIPVMAGPIPGLITISATVGASISLGFSLAFWPDPEEDAIYPCLNQTNPCFQVEPAQKTFEDAREGCASRGGRLANLASVSEATAVDNIATTGDYWIGGQAGFEYTEDRCSNPTYFNANSSTCFNGSETTIRWVDDDSNVVARGRGSGNLTYTTPATIFGGNGATLRTPMPTPSAMIYTAATGDIGLAAANTLRPSICQFEPATSIFFIKPTIKVSLGAAVGVGLSFCSPNDEIGICLAGTVNFLGLSIEPTFSYAETWLKDVNGSVFRRTQYIDFSIPWSIKLLEASLSAEIRFLIGSLSWEIIKFDGFTALEGKLYSFESANVITP